MDPTTASFPSYPFGTLASACSYHGALNCLQENESVFSALKALLKHCSSLWWERVRKRIAKSRKKRGRHRRTSFSKSPRSTLHRHGRGHFYAVCVAAKAITFQILSLLGKTPSPANHYMQAAPEGAVFSDHQVHNALPFLFSCLFACLDGAIDSHHCPGIVSSVASCVAIAFSEFSASLMSTESASAAVAGGIWCMLSTLNILLRGRGVLSNADCSDISYHWILSTNKPSEP